jgi:hypothetical protein
MSNSHQDGPHPSPTHLRRIVEAADGFLEVARLALATGSSPTELLALIRPLYRSALTLKDALPLDGPDMGMLTRGWPEPVATGRWILARRIDALLDRWGLGDFTRAEFARLAFGGSGPAMEVRSWALPMPLVTAEDVAAVEATAGSIRRALEEFDRGIRPPVLEKSSSMAGQTPSESAAPKPKRLKRGEPSLLIRAALESLANEGSWEAPEHDIILRSGVPRSTYYDVSAKDPEVKKTLAEYQRRRLGQPPVHADDL